MVSWMAPICWRVSRFNERLDDQLDAQGMMALAEIELLSDADRQAQLEIEAAARRAAMLTALIPIAFVDVVAVMMVNVRVIRRIAEIYGGRSGFLGSMRLLRAVMAHLVATGAVAIGEDMLEPLLGGSVLGKLSRRFGEGLVNGALTARVGVSALEVCRPLSFNATPRPKARTLIKQSLSGLVMRAKS